LEHSSADHFPESLTAVAAGASNSRGVVLLADDDAAARSLLKDLLSMSGFEVADAGDGVQAIDLFSQVKPDVVVTDIRMPGKDGLEVLAEVRQIDDTAPVVMVTGYGDLDSAVNALRRGAHDYLLKPINADLLIDAVTKGVELARLKRLERDYRRVLEQQVEERTKELAETNDFLSGILNSSRGVSIILTDLEGVIKFWNVGAENIYGYASEEMLGQHILQLFPERDYGVQTLADMNRLVQEQRKTIQEHVRRRAKDGRELTIFTTISPMLDQSGNIKGILSLGQDMTEQFRLHRDLRESYEKIRRIQGAFIFALAHLAESRDTETALHLKRIQAYCKVLCEQLSAVGVYQDILTANFVENLMYASILHDIGKVGLPDDILFNVDKFTEPQFEIMKQHTIIGGEALEQAVRESGEDSGYLTMGKEVAFYHHEHWDGKGYPFGLKDGEIPLSARIVAVADVYDALTTQRRYKNAFSHEEACDLIIQAKGKQFDPLLVEAFLRVEDQFQKIRDNFSRFVS